METAFLEDTVTLPYFGELHSQHRLISRYVESVPSGQDISTDVPQEQANWEVLRSSFNTEKLEIDYNPWLYAGVSQVSEPYAPRFQPETIIDPSVRPMLTDRVRLTLDRILLLLEGEARRSFIPVSKVEVSGFVDPEENTEEIVVTQWVGISAQAALAYWDKLGALVEFWIDFLPGESARIVTERLAIEVRWDANDTIF